MTNEFTGDITIETGYKIPVLGQVQSLSSARVGKNKVVPAIVA